MSTDPARPYRIDLIHTARTRIKQCGEEAVRLGIGMEYAATLRLIVENLSTAPLTWGDPLRHYEGADMLHYRQVIDRISVEYIVHEGERIVYIKDCKPVLGHPLESTT